MTIVISAKLPGLQHFVPGTPLELAGRVFAPLSGAAWEAAMGEFAVNHIALSLPVGEENRTRYAARLGLYAGLELLSADEKDAVEEEMLATLDRVLPPVEPKVRWWHRIKLARAH